MLYKELLDALLLPPLARSPSALLSSQVAGQDTPENTGAGEGVSDEMVLPTESPWSWDRLFAHLDLDLNADLSPSFVIQSRPIISGNTLRFGVREARTLKDMVRSWYAYVDALGLGTPDLGAGASKADAKGGKGKERNSGRTEDTLELVYRRAGGRRKAQGKKSGRRKADRGEGGRRDKRQKRRGRDEEGQSSMAVDQPKSASPVDEGGPIEERDLAVLLATPSEKQALTPDASAPVPIEQSEDAQESQLRDHRGDASLEIASDPERDAEDDELAWAIEMSQSAVQNFNAEEERGEVTLRTSQRASSPPVQNAQGGPVPTPPPTPPHARGGAEIVSFMEGTEEGGSGSIIGRTVFKHSPRRLAAHLASVIQWWMGEREAEGVSIEYTKRCGWCEFEEACEWR